MAINDALSDVAVAADTKDLDERVKQFPVRDGETPWTAAEVKEVADELTSDIDRLTGELAAADLHFGVGVGLGDRLGRFPFLGIERRVLN